ncbi:MAG: uracil-DNA glycosylase [Chloroflexi bacterium]|nr:uracil-DNA glycosylase [Chloroflexota bacterium]
MAELEEIAQQVRTCTDCRLAESRTIAVPGEGPDHPALLFIGEAPGYHEDQQGRPFVGAAGQFLEQLLASIGLRRDQVFITNMVKCRPPNNRDPLPGEIAACGKYLDRQVQLLRPKVVVTLGRHSLAKFLPGATISKVHGRPRSLGSFILYPMYHPAAALHQQSLRSIVEEDFKKIPSLLTQQAKPTEEAPASQQLSLL